MSSMLMVLRFLDFAPDDKNHCAGKFVVLHQTGISKQLTNLFKENKSVIGRAYDNRKCY